MSERKTHTNNSKIKHLSFWELGLIFGGSLGLPVFFTGKTIALQNGPETAIISVVTGNLILWMIALGIVAMSFQERVNAIDNANNYLGKIGGVLALLFIVLGFLGWFSIQIKASIVPLTNLFVEVSSLNSNSSLRLGAGLGLLIALLSIGGIRSLKYACGISVFVAIAYTVYSLLFYADNIPFTGTYNFSISSTIYVLNASFAAIVYTPTIFRFAKTRPDAFLALFLMTVVVIFFQISGIWVGSIFPKSTSVILDLISVLNFIFLLVFILISVVSGNMFNLYLAVAGWSSLIKKKMDAKAFAIGGLAGTAIFTFFQISPPMQFLERAIDGFIASLGVILIAAYLIKVVVRHRPRNFDKIINMSCWMVGCATTVIVQSFNVDDDTKSFLWGIGATFFSLLLVIFFEEVVWSVKNLRKYRR